MKLTEFADKLDQRKSIELLEYLEESDDELRLGIAELLMDGHLCELTATKRVERMKAPVLMEAPDKVWNTSSEHPMLEYMGEMGLIPERCKEMIDKAYERAKEHASRLGVSAPRIPNDMNKWDAYYTMAMVLSDYWMTISGDLDKASMLAYEIVSDIDKNR